MVGNIINKDTAVKLALILTAIIAVITAYNTGKNDGYKLGYKKGYGEAIEAMAPAPKPKADTVQTTAVIKTETQTTVRPKTKADKADVVIKTAPPTVTASVNGKKYEFKPQSEILETGIKTTATLNIKVPERRWTVGIGTDGHKPSYMIKAPIRNAVGIWMAGTGKDKIMGGVSISF